MFLASTNREPGAALLRGYRLPTLGVWKTLPAHLLPEAALRHGENVYLRSGALRSRPGLAEDASQGDYIAIVHGVALTAMAFVTSDNVKHVVVATTLEVAILTDDVWQLATPMAYTAQAEQPPQFTILEHDGQVSMLMIVPGMGLFIKREAAAAFTLVTGLPPELSSKMPQASDIITAANRVVIVVPPYRVYWSDSLSPTEWQDSSVAILAETTDAIVAIAQLGTLGFAIYKEGSIFLGAAQQGADAFAFRFEMYGEAEGPAGVNAVASINNVHYRFTPSGRLGLFTGTQDAFIADGLWPFLTRDIDPLLVKRSHCAYDYSLNIITCYYAAVSDSGSLHSFITLNLPYPHAGITTYAYFTGKSHLDITASLSVKLYQSRESPFVFARDNGMNRVLRSSEDALHDAGIAYACSMQPGLTPTPDAVIARCFIELQAHRGEEHGMVDIAQVTSHLLENEDGTVEESATQLDLSQRAMAQFLGFSQAATFLSFRLDWLSEANLVYHGCDLYGRETAMHGNNLTIGQVMR